MVIASDDKRRNKRGTPRGISVAGPCALRIREREFRDTRLALIALTKIDVRR